MDNISKEEALVKVAEVLEQTLAEYETLEKMETETTEESEGLAKADFPPQADQQEGQQVMENAAEDKDEEEDQEEDDQDDQGQEDDESDDELVEMHKAIMAKMETRGLLKKNEKAKEVKTEEPMKKTEDKSASEDLRKSVDDRFEMLGKAIQGLTETVTKIASQPSQPRKGITGYSPLKKNEEGESQTLSKTEVIGKLLDLRKSGDRRIDTSLINRFETGRTSQQDIEFIKGILG
jgi:hypothetical protein